MIFYILNLNEFAILHEVVQHGFCRFEIMLCDDTKPMLFYISYVRLLVFRKSVDEEYLVIIGALESYDSSISRTFTFSRACDPLFEKTLAQTRFDNPSRYFFRGFPNRLVSEAFFFRPTVQALGLEHSHEETILPSKCFVKTTLVRAKETSFPLVT